MHNPVGAKLVREGVVSANIFVEWDSRFREQASFRQGIVVFL